MEAVERRAAIDILDSQRRQRNASAYHPCAYGKISSVIGCARCLQSTECVHAKAHVIIACMSTKPAYEILSPFVKQMNLCFFVLDHHLALRFLFRLLLFCEDVDRAHNELQS